MPTTQNVGQAIKGQAVKDQAGQAGRPADPASPALGRPGRPGRPAGPARPGRLGWLAGSTCLVPDCLAPDSLPPDAVTMPFLCRWPAWKRKLITPTPYRNWVRHLHFSMPFANVGTKRTSSINCFKGQSSMPFASVIQKMSRIDSTKKLVRTPPLFYAVCAREAKIDMQPKHVVPKSDENGLQKLTTLSVDIFPFYAVCVRDDIST